MLFDEAYDKLSKDIELLSSDATKEGADYLRRQLDECLNQKCSRYDVHNVYSTLFPKVIETSPDATEVVRKRNAERNEHEAVKAADLREVASIYMMGPAWFTWWVEYRLSNRQRIGALIRAVDTSDTLLRIDGWYKDWDHRYVVTMATDSLTVPGRIEYVPDAFEIFVDPTTELYASVQHDPWLRGKALDAAQQLAEVVRRCIELINWHPVAAASNAPMPGQPSAGGNAQTSHYQPNKAKSSRTKRPSKSATSVIRFEPYLAQHKQKCFYSGGSGLPQCWHHRKGGYRNYTIMCPLGGRFTKSGALKRLTFGKNYGRLKFRPSEVNFGNGPFRPKVGVIRVGDLTSPQSPPAAPAPDPEKPEEQTSPVPPTHPDEEECDA
jgi:hypothetical protein